MVIEMEIVQSPLEMECKMHAVIEIEFFGAKSQEGVSM
jgi:hypothetical protein